MNYTPYEASNSWGCMMMKNANVSGRRLEDIKLLDRDWKYKRMSIFKASWGV